MTDRQTDSVWTHIDGKAVGGALQQRRMPMLPLQMMTWKGWKAAYPSTTVLSPDTPFKREYTPVRIAVLNQDEALIGDGRLPSNTLVVGVEVEGSFKAYSLPELERSGGVVNDMIAERPVLVFFDAATRTGLAFLRTTNGRELTFYNASSGSLDLRDRESSSIWNTQGRATSGALNGAALKFLPSFISEWYGWSGYHPETTLYRTLR